MTNRPRLGHAVALSVLAFLMHSVWEWGQCSIFFVHGSFEPTWSGMVVATAGDVFLTWTIYAVVALVSRRWRWSQGTWTWTQIGVLIGTSLTLAVAGERWALGTGRWDYSGAMPMVPGLGVGFVPLLQLLLLTPLVILIVDRLSAPVAASTATVRDRYDRIAPVYDLFEWLIEWRFRGWRRELWSQVTGGRVLELGVGTGKNLPFHPSEASVVALDISPGMLRRARRRAAALGSSAQLLVADAEALPFEDGSFDVVVATFLFCSVPDAARGLREARRMLAPGGRLLLLEHVLSERPILRALMRWVDPIPFHVWGAHIDRETVASVRTAGLVVLECQNKSLDIVKLIVACPPEAETAALTM